jgi:hypothetical protein
MLNLHTNKLEIFAKFLLGVYSAIRVQPVSIALRSTEDVGNQGTLDV